MSKLRQRVVDPWRNGRKDRARHQAVPLQTSERQGQHPLRNAAERTAQLVEPFGAVAQRADHQHRPFVADAREHLAYRAAILGHVQVLGISDVPSCRRRLGIYLALVSNRNQGRPRMAKVKVAVIVGSNRRDSINRKLAQALAGLGQAGLAFHFVSIEDLPLYNQDLEGELPPSVVRFKSDIAAADAVLFVTPEHNRSIPAVLKNAIDWGARPMGRTRGAESRRPSPGHRLARSERRWRNCTCDRFLEPWGPLSWAGKPTSLSSRASWMQTGRSPMRRRGDFSRLSSISSRRR